jgi:8-amino-7-oxononanoate synthase
MDKFADIRRQLDELEAANLLRSLRVVNSIDGPLVRIDGSDRPLVNFSSNDYLNIAGDPKVIQAVTEAVQRWGFGAGASRLICGTTEAHVRLEEAFARFLHKEAALFLPCGWMANEAVLRTLPQKGDIVLMDKSNHASIIDGVSASPAEFRTWRRDNPERLARYLDSADYGRKFIVTESIFSMDGDAADLEALVRLKNAHNAILIVDEAHSVGCMGKTGAGLAEKLGLLDDIDIIIAPCGKAMGASGAIVAADRVVIDYLINTARPFIYTTAPSPVNCAAISAAIEIVEKEPQRREKLAKNAAYLRNHLSDKGMDIASSSSHIVPVIIGDSAEAVAVSGRLYERGFLVAAIRPPTVPRGSARLRISVQSGHTAEQIDGLVDALAEQPANQDCS